MTNHPEILHSSWVAPLPGGPPVGTIWVFDSLVTDNPSILAAGLTLMSREEQSRAKRFLVPDAYNSFVSARAGLRIILGALLGTAPARVTIVADKMGKPFVPGAGGERLSFNLSHSGERILFAVRDGQPVGIDIEAHRELRQAKTIADRHFSPEEHKIVAASEQPGQATFFTFWSRREALAKAMGIGMSMPFNQIELPTRPETSAFAPRIRWPEAPPGPWWINDLNIALEYSAALSWRGHVDRIQIFNTPIVDLIRRGQAQEGT